MFIVIIFIFLGFVLVLSLVWLIKQHLFFKDMLKQTKKCNCVVAGKIGTGKGLIFQKIINCRKEPYYCNVDYGGDYEHIEMNEISVAPNTYENFIAGKIAIVERKFKEQQDIYIDDAGVYLPSYMDAKLYKQYPSMPIYYALCRHSADHHIHCNVQNYGRLWKALREQADYFITCKKTIKLPFFLITKCITYDTLASAEQGLLPLKGRMLNKYSKAEVDLYYAQHGEIKTGWIIQRKRKIKYNTRYFEKVLYGQQPSIKKGS